MAAGIDIRRVCLHEAIDVMVVLSSTFRATSFDDFSESLSGGTKSSSGSGRSGSGGDDNMSLGAFMALARSMGAKG